MPLAPLLRAVLAQRHLGRRWGGIGAFRRRAVAVRGVRRGYQVFVPAGPVRAAGCPVLLFIAGGRERGDDNAAQMAVGLAPAIAAHATTFPMLAAFPQIPRAGVDRDAMKAIVLAVLDAVLRDHDVDASRVYLTGISFGGVLAYELAAEHPTRFAALVPVSATVSDACVTAAAGAPAGQGVALVARRLAAMPTWIFHGARDAHVPAAAARDVARALEDAGAAVRYTELPDGGHDAATWAAVYARADLHDWLLAQRR